MIIDRSSRVLIATGVVGPAVFVADWAILGATRNGYSPLDDAISRLAATASPSRGAMTAGFLVYGGALIAFAASKPPPGASCKVTLAKIARLLLAGSGLATIGVAAFPLDAAGRGNLHAVFAGIGYATLAAAALTAAPSAAAVGARRWAWVSRCSGVASAALLAASTFAPDHGLLQRMGLTTGDAWVVCAALRMLLAKPDPGGPAGDEAGHAVTSPGHLRS